MLMGGVTVSAQVGNNDWSRVESLSSNTRLVVEMQAGQSIKGKLLSATPSVLNISRDGRPIVLQQQDIARVYIANKGSRFKSALIGAGVGAAVGIGISAAYVYATKGDPLIAAGGLLYGLPAGAAIGGLAGGKSKKGLLVYEYR